MSNGQPSSEHVHEDWLINLLNGLLTSDAEQIGLSHLSSCQRCEERFQQLARERERLVAAPKPHFTAGRLVLDSPRTKARRRPSRIWFGSVAAAAALALLFFGPALWQPRQEVLEYWLPVDQPEALLRSSPPSEQAGEFLAALEAYRARDARKALELLQNARVEKDEVALRDLYLASALVLIERYTEADSVLQRLEIRTLPQPWRRQARWVQYIAFRKSAQSDRAAEILESLVDEPGDIGERARREKSRLQSLL